MMAKLQVAIAWTALKVADSTPLTLVMNFTIAVSPRAKIDRSSNTVSLAKYVIGGAEDQKEEKSAIKPLTIKIRAD
jgi:hypothetical protein